MECRRIEPSLWAACGLIAFLLSVISGASAHEKVTGEWTALAPLPEERTEVSVTTDGRLVYVIGGFAAGREAPRTMYAYDPAGDRWTALGEIPQGVNHAGFAALDGRLYIVGGYRESTFRPIDTLRIYDLESGTWRDGAPAHRSRRACGRGGRRQDPRHQR